MITAQLSIAIVAAVFIGRDQGSNDFVWHFCAYITGRSFSKYKWRKTSIRKPTLQSNTRSNLENLQYQLTKARNESDIYHLIKEFTAG